MKVQTVPICDNCWRIEEGDRKPVRMKNSPVESCYRCKQKTVSGIYVRREVEDDHK